VEVIVLDDESHGAAGGGIASKPTRRFGTMAGQITAADDFDTPLPAEIERAFQGDDD
jgi:hypothetical protein